VVLGSRERVFLALGSNVGDRLGNILGAIVRLSAFGKVVRVSTVYWSEPWGVLDQPPFLNCVVELRTHLSPRHLLLRIKEVEKELGRKERFRWGPREIDIDILLYGDRVIAESDLRIPHPHLENRDFFLAPLLELDGKLRNPEKGTELRLVLTRMDIKLRPFCSILPLTLRTSPRSRG